MSPIKQRDYETSSLKAKEDVTNYGRQMYFKPSLGLLFPDFSRDYLFAGQRQAVVKTAADKLSAVMDVLVPKRFFLGQLKDPQCTHLHTLRE